MWGRWLLSFMFLAAALLKLMFPGDVAAVVAYLFRLPPRLPGLAFVEGGLVVWEVAAGVALLLFAGSRWTLVVAAVTLLVFTVFLVLLQVDQHAPGCGCFGPVSRGRDDLLWGLARNVAGLVLVASVWCRESNHAQCGAPSALAGVHTY